jgi:hypothetical protein
MYGAMAMYCGNIVVGNESVAHNVTTTTNKLRQMTAFEAASHSKHEKVVLE